MNHPFFRDVKPTLHISHRGGACLAPENTMLAFRMAVERFRTDMLEIDVRVTTDGELVVMHDAALDRTTDGVGMVGQHTWPELLGLEAGFRFQRAGAEGYPYRGKGVRIPLLREVLRAFPGMRFNIEVKDDVPSIELGVADVIREARVMNLVCVGSEEDGLSRRLLEVLPDACHFYPREAAIRMVLGLGSGQKPGGEDPYEVLDLPLYFDGMRLISAEFVSRAASVGRWVNVWTVDDEAEMVQLVDQRVGGIMTDRPDLLRQVLGPSEVP